jgi:hypothetical protein
MGKLQLVLVALLVLGAAQASEARTWRVEKDGTGDYSIIYEAVDAAASGDTIQIGPGRFEEYRLEPEYAWETYCCVHASSKNLTLIGSGVELTTIGFEEMVPGPFIVGISSYQCDLVVENLTVRKVEDGFAFWEGENLRIQNCNIAECDNGVVIESIVSTMIDHCRIIGTVSRGILGSHPNGVSITNCEFISTSHFAISGVGGIGWCIRDTDFQGGSGGIQFEQGATGVVERCDVQVAGGNPPAIGLLTGSVFSLFDNEFIGDDIAAYFATGGTTVTARNNIFVGGAWTCLQINSTPMDFHQNHILNGGGASVRALWERGSLTDPVVVDLTDNYWGTDDPAQIAAWTDDYNDYPSQDLWHYVIIDYTPFEGQPVQTESTTWGAVKTLFR